MAPVGNFTVPGVFQYQIDANDPDKDILTYELIAPLDAGIELDKKSGLLTWKFAAGEITGIAGALKSICEGEIAALAILHEQGQIAAQLYEKRLAKLLKERHHHLQFGKYFNLLYRIPGAAYLDIPDDTLVCRCEDVTMGDIKKAVANGYDTPATLKIALRSAMGDCQGRICGPVIYDILAALTGRSQGSMTPLVVRPPVKPVRIDSLASF